MSKREVITHSAEETIDLGQRVGRQLRGGEVVRLIGDVGAGKTTLVRGLVAGIDSPDHVSSPTFTVHKLYRGRISLYHYDFYRVGDDEAIASELSEIMYDPDVSVVLEWPEYARLSLPVKPVDIVFTTTDEHERKLTITIPNEISYIKLP